MRAHLAQMFHAGIAACHPSRVLPPHLPAAERAIVLAIGKAAGAMAEVAEAHYPAAAGVAVVPHGVAAALARIELLHAGHPVPDPASVAAADALAAAAGEAERLGYRPVILGECEGEAREIGAFHAGIAGQSPPGTALISGGEPTVTVTGHGRGGPNLEYALAASGREGIAGLAADSDGLDGTSGAAGAFFGGDAEGAAAALAANDSAAWCAARGALFVTGPTGTNVNDLRIILVG